MDGLIIVNKPQGLTSHDVCEKIKRILHTKKVGHTGTLDPMATGVLVVAVGKATKLIQYLGADMWNKLSDKEKNETLLEYCMRINSDDENYNSQQIAHQLKSEMIDEGENDWYKEKQNQEVGRNLREDIQKQLKRKQSEQQTKSRQNNRNYLQKGKGRK